MPTYMKESYCVYHIVFIILYLSYCIYQIVNTIVDVVNLQQSSTITFV